jgi:hypothetical protein
MRTLEALVVLPAGIHIARKFQQIILQFHQYFAHQLSVSVNHAVTKAVAQR